MIAAALALTLAASSAVVDDQADPQALVTAAVARTSQDIATPAVPPPVLFAQAPAGEAPPPLDASPPADVSPPAAAPPPADPAAPTPAPDATVPAPDAATPPGMDGIIVGAAQVGTGCLTLGICTACTLVPYLGACAGILSPFVVPALIGSLDTIVGDTLGQKRGAILWPIAASCGGAVVGCGLNVLGIGATYLIGAAAFATAIAAAQANPAAAPFVLLAALGPILVIPLVTYVVYASLVIGAPVVAYALTAENKKPGDTGQFTAPGLIEPNHPTAAEPTQASRRAPAGRYAQAMAF